MISKPINLFVYGTLGLGRPNEHILSDIGGTWQNASITGKLTKKGWGAEMGYPGIILDAEGEEVEGFVFTSQNLSHHWTQLDGFEGKEYKRVLTQARLDDGNIVDTYVYALKTI